MEAAAVPGGATLDWMPRPVEKTAGQAPAMAAGAGFQNGGRVVSRKNGIGPGSGGFGGAFWGRPARFRPRYLLAGLGSVLVGDRRDKAGLSTLREPLP